MDEKLFEVKSKVLLRDGILPFLGTLIGIGIFYMIGAFEEEGLYKLGLIVTILLIIFGSNIYNLLLNSYILIDKEKIKIRLKSDKVEVKFKDIISIWITKDEKHKYLEIVNSEDTYSIFIESFDYDEVWSTIKRYAKPESIGDYGLTKLPEYEEWKKERKKLATEIKEFIVIKDSNLFTYLGWGAIILMSIAVVFSYLEGEIIASLLFIPFVGLGVLLLLIKGKTYINSSSIIREHMFRKYKIDWKEVKLIEMTPRGDGLVFIGNNKQLSIPGPMYWSTKTDESAQELFYAQVDYNNIEIKETPKANFRFNKNTKIKDE